MLSFASYFSVEFLAVLFPITVATYAVLPQKPRRIVLLLSSYAFFWAVSGKLLIYLLLSTLSIHHFGLWLTDNQRRCENALEQGQKEERKGIKACYQRQQRWIVAFAVILHIGVLAVLKYSPFFVTNLNAGLRLLKMSPSIAVPSFALPIGISFYTMQAVSYVLDVYHRKINADHNLFRLALYMSFFPQIMEGPICRYSETAEQLWSAPPMEYRNLTFGLQRVLFGILKKVVIADRLNLFITNVFNGYQDYDGFVIAVAAVCYTIQLYMDFSGTMDVALGIGQIFGVSLTENFQRPFFSKTISEFWKRWHITLGTWFRDYIFYPISLSKPMKHLVSKARKRLGNYFGALSASAVALFCVWLCNGLWHGASWNFIFFGMYHFALILGGNIIKPFVVKITEKLHISRTTPLYRGFQILRTTVLVCIGEMFFRANGLRAGLEMFQKIFTGFTFSTITDKTFFSFGVDLYDYIIVAIVLLIIFIIGLQQEKGVSIRERISTKPVVLRYAVYYTLIMAIVIFGAYGAGYIPVAPIYASF
ncbi:MAG: MBOAT family O-acyltransferase [Oscillospiraceae bacterium]|nr:MBOAT family O-acyltransferase [Oscillospiraceae bacterium]